MRRSSSEHSTLPQLTLYWSHSCTPCYRIFGATKAVSSRCSSFWCFQLEIEPNTRLRGKRGSLCCMCVFLWWLPGLLIFLSNYQFLQISSYFSLMIRFHYISGISSIIFLGRNGLITAVSSWFLRCPFDFMTLSWPCVWQSHGTRRGTTDCSSDSPVWKFEWRWPQTSLT